MHIPMEFLSPTTTRADSGAGIPDSNTSRSSSGRTSGNGARFEKAFERELDRHDRKLLDKQKGPKGYTDSKNAVDKTKPSGVKEENIIDENGAAALIAGVMGEQEQEVVFILEGEESVATPQMRVENPAGQPDFDPNAGATVVDTDTENAVKTDSIQGEAHAEKSETAEFKEVLTAKTEATTQDNKAEVAGEVTARMPEVKPEDGKSNEQSGGNLKDNGNPGPLENENENAQAAGQDGAYAKAAAAVKSKAEGETESKPAEVTPVGNEAPPPLSEGIKPEQFKSAQQMTQAAMQNAVKPENLFQEMIQRVETMQDAAKSTMTIQLNPEFLGKVALEIAVDAAGLHVKINAEDSSVRGMISSQLATLIESLESKGIAVSEVEVVYAGANFETFSEHGDGKQGSSGQENAGKTGKDAKDSVEYYTSLTDLMDYYLDAGISSVEFSA